jgi:hypothetical protein
LAASISEKMTATEFHEEVWKAWQSYLGMRGLPREQWPALDPKDKKYEKKHPLPFGKNPPVGLDFDVWTWDEPESPAEGKKDPKAAGDKDKKRARAHYWLYFYKNGAQQAVVIYQVPQARANDPATLRGIDASIKSLALGNDSSERRMGFRKWK